jgi:hypothetical protein
MNEIKRAVPNRPENRKTPRALAALGAVLFLGLSSCAQMLPGLGKLEDATNAVYPIKNVASGSTGFDVFQSIVFPLISQSKCTGCHTAQQPTIAAVDMEAAYTAAKSRITPSAPSTSILITKSQDNHCAGCPSASRSEWTAAVEQWATAENAGTTGGSGGGTGGGGTDPGPVVTPPPVVDLGTPPVYVTPAQLLNGSTTTNKTIALSGYNASFNGVSLIYNLTDPYAAVANTARIYSLRIQNNSANYVLVRNIRLFQSVDATIDPMSSADYKPDLGAVFSDVDVVVNPNSTAVISFGEALLPKGAQDGLYYAFGFQALSVGCKSIPTFSANVNPILSNRCTTCHNAGGPGSGAWTFSADPTVRCIQALQRSDVMAPIGSKLIQYPYYKQNAHPATSMTAADVDAIINWLTLER